MRRGSGGTSAASLPSVALLLALGALALACADPDAVGSDAAAVDSGSAGARLDAIIDAWVESSRGDGGGAPDLSVAAFTAAIDEDREMLAALRGIPADELSRPQAIDRAYLIGRLEADVRDAEVRRRWETDPNLYVRAGRLYAALEVAEADDASIAELTAALEWLADAGSLEAAAANLRRPPRRFTEAALFQAERILETIETRVSAIAAGAADASLQSALASARSTTAALVDFLRDDLLPRSDGEWAVGADHYTDLLRLRWLMEDDAETILGRGWQAFEETEAEAREVADRIRPGADWVAVYEGLKDDHPDADPEAVKAGYQQPMDAAQRFVRANGVVTLPQGEHVITVDTPPAMRRSSPFGTFQTVDPFGDDLQGRLVLTPIEEDWSEERQRERLRSHHRAWLPVIAVHEAYPGHHVHALKARENPRILRRVAGEPITIEGWGLFTEQLMFELGFLQGDDVRLTVLRNRLWRAARVILDVSLHTGRMSIEEAVDFLVERVRFERYAAELEVGMYPRRPTYVLGYLIGMQEIERLRDDWIAANGDPQPPARLYDALLTAGGIPPALLRAELLGTPIPER